MSNKSQTEFSETYKFASRCSHCGKPMGYMSIDRWDKEQGPMGSMFKRDVFVMWIDPQHECDYLSITEKVKEAA